MASLLKQFNSIKAGWSESMNSMGGGATHAPLIEKYFKE